VSREQQRLVAVEAAELTVQLTARSVAAEAIQASDQPVCSVVQTFDASAERMALALGVSLVLFPVLTIL
jgi:hypothetical protein